MAQEFLSFKRAALQAYADAQWKLLVDNNYSDQPPFLNAAREAIAAYAQSILTRSDERVFALEDSGKLAFSTGPLTLKTGEAGRIISECDNGEPDTLYTGNIAGSQCVYQIFAEKPLGWRIVLANTHSAFYRDVARITWQTVVVLAASLALSIVLLSVLSGALTQPLNAIAGAMESIIKSGDLSRRVEVLYDDETGHLAAAFNVMTADLEASWQRTKQFAFDAVLAQKKEARIRTIFQKYVPKSVIDACFEAPDALLVGENREVAILFSDIRSFTSISEQCAPDALVRLLNRYFSAQVDVIMQHEGIVDKYIGDAIMALWGAPARHKDDPLQSVLAAFDMLDALAAFNEAQRKAGDSEFHIGIGINYGLATVGNIGSEKKMDYTVIGDAVNLASRLEGLTKIYHEGVLISEFLYAKVAGRFPTRLLDTVAVKGKTRGVRIYAARRALSDAETRAWTLHNEAMALFYKRDFAGAIEKLTAELALTPGDPSAESIRARSQRYLKAAPTPDWNGVEIMRTK
jgi:class 3 adenylate cyclase/HAMP domain-containing protein